MRYAIQYWDNYYFAGANKRGKQKWVAKKSKANRYDSKEAAQHVITFWKLNNVKVVEV